MSRIKRSEGITATEKFLSECCDKTFLKLWTFPNPFKKQGVELCDVLVVFENHIFIFSVKEIVFNLTKDLGVAWARWKKKAIDDSIKQVVGAERWLRQNPKRVFLDAKCQTPFPFNIPKKEFKIHRIIIADGAEKACKNQSPENVTGSLAITYEDNGNPFEVPFLLSLKRTDIVHVLDTTSLKIVLGELDTITDLVTFFEEKEKAIQELEILSYCGEEDLVAHYFNNFDQKSNRHKIGVNNKDYTGVHIAEGEWADFKTSDRYKRKKTADKVSYVWDKLLQKTGQNALDGVLIGDGNVFEGPSAIAEMAKEPRFFRRALSENILRVIEKFPETGQGFFRMFSSMQSFSTDKRYVLLQVKHDESKDYETEYRPLRLKILQVACWAEKEKFPHLKKVVGIGIDAPKFHKKNSEDFVLLFCENWPENLQKEFEEMNEVLGFYKTGNVESGIVTTTEFPSKNPRLSKKIGRNDKCPCGSGLKYKRCCLQKS